MPARYDEVAALRASAPDDLSASAIAALLDLIRPVDRGRVLDLACGHGIVARELVRRGADVVGLDLSAELIEHANRADQKGPQKIS